MTVPRPRRSDDAARNAAIEKLAADCVEWAQERENVDSLDDWRRILQHQHLSGNGYELARDIDRRYHVDPDLELVEILDNASFYLDRAHDDAVREWVAANGIKPALQVGARIRYRGWTGTVNGIYDDLALYALKPDGEADRFQHGGGILVAFEDAQALA